MQITNWVIYFQFFLMDCLLAKAKENCLLRTELSAFGASILQKENELLNF